MYFCFVFSSELFQLKYFGAQIRIRVTVESESDDSWWVVWPLSIKSNETMPTQSCWIRITGFLNVKLFFFAHFNVVYFLIPISCCREILEILNPIFRGFNWKLTQNKKNKHRVQKYLDKVVHILLALLQCNWSHCVILPLPKLFVWLLWIQHIYNNSSKTTNFKG